jgi:hypothetical protein
MGTGSFLGTKRPERGVGQTLPSNTDVKETVELYIYSTCETSWLVLGYSLHLTPPFLFMNLMWVLVGHRDCLDTGDKKIFCFSQAIIQQLTHSLWWLSYTSFCTDIMKNTKIWSAVTSGEMREIKPKGSLILHGGKSDWLTGLSQGACHRRQNSIQRRSIGQYVG